LSELKPAIFMVKLNVSSCALVDKIAVKRITIVKSVFFINVVLFVIDASNI
jgi:hypothetical protein